MYYLSINFERVLVLTLMSCFNQILLERVLYYLLVREVIRLEMLGELLVLVVRTIMRVFCQLCME